MKRFMLLFVMLLMFIAVFVTGCMTSTSKITATDLDPATGKVTKVTVTETKESVVEQVIASTQNKSVFIFREVYAVGVKAEPSETMFSMQAMYTHSNTGLASILPAHNTPECLTGIATVMSVMKSTDSVSLGPQGISSGSGSSSVTSTQASGISAPAAKSPASK
ncbi:MAG: hypothetical protein WC071_09530 [Victivallaceae bacterium]